MIIAVANGGASSEWSEWKPAVRARGVVVVAAMFAGLAVPAVAQVPSRPDVAGQVIATVEAARVAPESQTRSVYLGALQQLGNFDEGRSVVALLPALKEDRDARLKALESLRWLSQTERSEAAVQAVWSAFQAADDTDVERAALEVLVRYGDQSEVMAALEPLAVSEGPNQDLAIRERIRIHDELLEGDPQPQ